MKFKLPKDALRDVELSREDQNALVYEAETIVRETIAANEAFLESDATFQDSQWKSVREKGGLRVYCQRRKSRRTSKARSDQMSQETFFQTIRNSSKSTSRYRACEDSSTQIETSMPTYSAFAENTTIEKIKPLNVPLMALAGTTDGALDDCMFGCLAPTDEAWRLRNAHIHNHLDEARIVATIKRPTRKDPFRYLGVKWFTHENPVMLSSIMQQRDFLVLEFSGITRDSEGVKVGYFMMHSIKLREVPELSDMGLVRGAMSFCCLFRQSRPGRIAVLSLGFFDSHGGMPSRIATASAAEGIINLAGVAKYAYAKKLMWCMTHNGRQLGQTDAATKYCQACKKGLTKFMRSVSNGSCQICRLVICVKCSVIKKMTVDVSKTGGAQQCSLRFCLGCMVQAKQQSPSKMVFHGTETAFRFPEDALLATSRVVAMPQTPLDKWTDDPYSEYLQPPQSRTSQRMNFARTKYPERLKAAALCEFQNRAAQSLPIHDDLSRSLGINPPEKAQSMRGFRPRAYNKAVHDYLDEYEVPTRQ